MWLLISACSEDLESLNSSTTYHAVGVVVRVSFLFKRFSISFEGFAFLVSKFKFTILQGLLHLILIVKTVIIVIVLSKIN